MSKELKALKRKIRKILNDNYGNKKDHGQTVKQLVEMIVKNNAVLPIVSGCTNDRYGIIKVADEGANQCELCKYYTEPIGCDPCSYCMKVNKPEEYYR